MISPEILDHAIRHAKENSTSLIEAERALEQPAHTELGQLLTEKWKLPRQIQVSALYHHESDFSKRDNISSEVNEIIDIIMLANLLIHALKFGHSGHDKILGAPKTLMTRLNIGPDRVKDVVGKIKKSLENAEAFLRIVGGEE